MHSFFRNLLLGCLVALSACGEKPAAPAASAAEPQFVGSSECADCHSSQYSDWTDSHHDLAMQAASEATVLGDFNNASFDYFGTKTTFLRDDDRFIVQTANASGASEEFQVTHTFGVSPLQQYLVEFPGGRLQSLPFAWDARLQSVGGQRWFHLYPDEFIAPGDELHWTGRAFNWNYMCAECHSTDLHVNYDISSDSFATSWAEVNVGCEACHGPASVHVAEAHSGKFSSSKGLALDLDDQGRAVWEMNPQTGIAERSELALQQTRQPEACGRCHARRSVITAEYEYGKALAETHALALLESPLYYDDGQIRDEVYVYGSFIQSRMHRAGVTCSDCHNPHSLELHTGAVPSDVCAQCHLPTKFATTEHHRHDAAQVACVDCHMPASIYMQVDPRRDHSFRVPRPDVSISSNAPNACNSCHTDRDAAWAATVAAGWWGDTESHFATVFAKSRSSAANVELNAVVSDRELPGIVRATAISRLSSPPTQSDAEAIQMALLDADPLLRRGAVRAARTLPPDALLQLLAPLLRDPLRSVRIEAASALSGVHEYLSNSADFSAAAAEYRAAMLSMSSRPEAHIALGDFATSMGDPEQAVKHYSTALAMDPSFVASRLNFADALRRFGDEAGAEKLLRDGISQNKEHAELHHAYGLLLVRTERPDAGLAELREAARLAPDNARFVYVEAIALNSLGQATAAVQALKTAHARFVADFDIAWALATMLRDSGDRAGAMTIVETLALQHPGDDRVATLRASLQQP